MPELSLSQQMTMAPQDYFDIGFLAGAKAMQEEAAKIYDDRAQRCTRTASILREQGRYQHAHENHINSEQYGREAAAIRALDPEKVGG